MATFAVSFNLNWDTSASYSERYDSLMEAIRKRGTVWAETTSFALVQTDETLEAFEIRLYLTKINAATDILIVIDVSYDASTMRGAIADRTKLKQIMPMIQSK